MSPFLRLLLIVALALVVWWAVTAYRASRTEATSFTPVEDLVPEARSAIDAALARGEMGGAIAHYRAATGAGAMESRAAVETHRWKSGA